MDAAMRMADKEQASLKKSLDERLAARRRNRENALAKLKEEQDNDLETFDIEQLDEQEKIADLAKAEAMKNKEEKEAQSKSQTQASAQAASGIPALQLVNSIPSAGGNIAGDLVASLKSSIKGIADDAVQNASEIAREAEEKRKLEAKAKLRNITDEIDINLEKNNLLNQLASQSDAVANALEDDLARQKKKAEERRALLLARRKNKNKQALEEERVKAKLELIEEEEAGRVAMSADYIRGLFVKQPGAPPEDEGAREKKLELLNEYLSDQFLERMSGLLMKQFTEKEQLLRLLMQKYADQ